MQETSPYTNPDEDPIYLIEESNGDTLTTWTLGTPVASNNEKEKKTDDFLGQVYKDNDTKFVYEEPHLEFRQSNESDRFILGDEDDIIKYDDYIERGLIYHKIFELISTKDDVDAVIDELNGQGYFDSIVSVNEARTKIKEALSNPISGHWFDKGWKEFKECSIIFRKKNGEIKERRPDRVIVNKDETIVIDYKSGEKNDRHKDQIRLYMYLLKKMGYKNVKGFVWYFMTGDIVEEKGGLQ